MQATRSVRGRKAVPARASELNSARIATAALAVLDREGLEGFTMRAVADALGVTPMALYHHVADKAALAGLVVEIMMKGAPLPPPTGVWRDDMWAVALWMRRVTLAHPAVGRLRSQYRIWTPAMLQITDRWMALWQQTGLPLDRAVRASRMSSAAIIGLVEQDLAQREMTPPDASMLAMLPNARFAFTAPQDRDAEFEFVVRALIEGLYERLKQ